jgi:glycosyltransferase involved in cell wall biosynthesis
LENDHPLPHNALAKGFAFTRYGMLVHPFDEESLALAMDEAEKNYEIMCEHARSASGMLADKYSKDRVLDKLEGLYLELTRPK